MGQDLLSASELQDLHALLQYASADELARIHDLLTPRSSQHCPHQPTPRQQAFLELEHLEALYGGAAGGGKSDALLMDAAQFVHEPDYRALMLRRTFSDLSLPGALMDRAKSWWIGKAHWNEKTKTFRWPSGATITFGYLESESDKYRYQGAEFHRIYLDELTQFPESAYLYLFSRLRRGAKSRVPIGMRAASNPGGVGHQWVRSRFLSPEAVQDLRSGSYRALYEHAGRAFVPSRLADNPFLDVVLYEEALNRLDPITRAQLKQGDWTAAAEGRFKPEWFLRYRCRDLMYNLLAKDGSTRLAIDSRECTRFFSIDPTVTGRERAQEVKGNMPHSWAVCSVWDTPRTRDWLLWRNLLRGQWDTPELCQNIAELAWAEHPDAILIECDGIGKAVHDILLTRYRLPMRAVYTEGKDKLQRSQTAQVEAHEGRIYLPEQAPWLDTLEAELFAWQGLPNEQADQIDTLSYAARARIEGVVSTSRIQGFVFR